MTPRRYLLYQPRYENETVDSENRNVVIRPGYDKVTSTKWRKRLGNGVSRYDSLTRETDLRYKSRRGDMEDSEREDNMNIHTILDVPSGDERSPACLIPRRGNQEESLRDIALGRSGNDWRKSEVQGEVKPSTGNLSPRSQAAFEIEDQPSSFEFYDSDLIDAEHEKIASEEDAHDEGISEY